jgi:hypothetical protein
MARIFLVPASQKNEIAADVARRLKKHGFDSLFPDFDPDAGKKYRQHGAIVPSALTEPLRVRHSR